MVPSKKVLADFPGVVMSIYDEENGKIYLLDNQQKNHRMINALDVIPTELLKDDLVYGYIREISQEYSINIPLPLIQLVNMFY